MIVKHVCVVFFLNKMGDEFGSTHHQSRTRLQQGRMRWLGSALNFLSSLEVEDRHCGER